MGIRYSDQHGTKEHFVYPDGLVTCDPRDRPDNPHLRYPKVIIEVLSPSTALYDRTEKFDLYKHIPTLEDYLLVSQDKPNIEVLHKVRDLPQAWLLKTFGTGDTLEITSLGFSCPVDNIYADWR